MASFEEILNRKTDEIERPKPLPVGTYLCTVEGLPEIKEIGQNQTPAAIFRLKPISAREDVDQDDLAAAKGLDNKSFRVTMFLTEDALWRLKKFAGDCGFDETGVSVREMINSLVNRQVYAKLKHRPSPDGTQIYAEVDSTAAV